jgi:uncharacterized protein (TIGR02118 family)
MIRVSVLYPNQPGSKFDQTYYFEKHVPMAKQQLGLHGLVRAEIDKGISAADPNAPAPFVAIAQLFFNSVEDVHQAFREVGRQVIGDIPNFTDVRPQIQISEILS